MKQGNRAGGTGSILFMPDLGGNVFYAKKIVSTLQSGHAVYGLRLDAELLGDLSGSTLQGLAQRFASDLDSSPLPAPLHLVGHSFAGFLAFETARYLASMGPKAGLVGLLDSNLPGRHYSEWYFRAISAVRSQLNRQRSQLKQRFSHEPIADPSMVLHASGFLRLDLSKHPESYRYIIRNLYDALVAYVPGKYAGDVTLFRARDRRWFLGSPRYLGWRRFVEGRIDLVRLAGNHLDLVRDDVSVVQIAGHLDRIVSEPED